MVLSVLCTANVFYPVTSFFTLLMVSFWWTKVLNINVAKLSTAFCLFLKNILFYFLEDLLFAFHIKINSSPEISTILHGMRQGLRFIFSPYGHNQHHLLKRPSFPYWFLCHTSRVRIWEGLFLDSSMFHWSI